jgi:acylphosphatase
MQVRAHVLIKGRVQGVFFRSEIKRRAEDLDTKGWTRNLPDGSVEAFFEGQESSVKKLVEFCRKGPSGARVADLALEWEDYIGEFKDFRIVY